MQTDIWLLYGLQGLLSIIEQRMDFDINIDLGAVEKQLDYVLQRIKNYKGTIKKDADPCQIDNWILRGLQGVVNIIERRPDNPIMESSTKASLQKEVMRFSRIVDKL